MTLAVAVVVPEGVAVGADSRMTYGNPKGWPRTASDFGLKVFKVTDRVAAATFGWAYLNKKNINSLIEEFKLGPLAAQKHEYIDEVTSAMADFFQDQYDAHVKAGHDKPVAAGLNAFGFIVGGYDKDGKRRINELDLPGKNILQRNSTGDPAAAWAGQIDVVSRLIKGWDPIIFPKVPQNVQQTLEKGEYIIRFQNMTLQDAVDFVIFLIRATIEMQRFSDGIIDAPGALPGVGGPVDIAVVTPYEFRWIQRKGLQGERTTFIETVGPAVDQE